MHLDPAATLRTVDIDIMVIDAPLISDDSSDGTIRPVDVLATWLDVQGKLYPYRLELRGPRQWPAGSGQTGDTRDDGVHKWVCPPRAGVPAHIQAYFDLTAKLA